jgi:hypothetical protein
VSCKRINAKFCAEAFLDTLHNLNMLNEHLAVVFPLTQQVTFLKATECGFLEASPLANRLSDILCSIQRCCYIDQAKLHYCKNIGFDSLRTHDTRVKSLKKLPFYESMSCCVQSQHRRELMCVTQSTYVCVHWYNFLSKPLRVAYTTCKKPKMGIPAGKGLKRACDVLFFCLRCLFFEGI